MKRFRKSSRWFLLLFLVLWIWPALVLGAGPVSGAATEDQPENFADKTTTYIDAEDRDGTDQDPNKQSQTADGTEQDPEASPTPTATPSVTPVAGPALTVQQKETTSVYRLRAGDLQLPAGYTIVRFTVWSKASGGQDQKLYTAKLNKAKTLAIKDIRITAFSGYGTYYCRCSAIDESGNEQRLKTVKFKVAKPVVESAAVTTDIASGSFTVQLQGVSAGAGIRKVQVRIWCKADQSDRKTYAAEKVSTGSYSLASDITAHQKHLGRYQVQVVVTDARGTQKKAAETAFNMKASAKLSVSSDGAERTYKVKAKSVKVPLGFQKVRALVWSKAGGKDDKVWYAAKKSGSTYTVTVDIAKHKTAGQYVAAFYAVRSSGEKVYLGKNTEIMVTSVAKATGSNGSLTGGKGIFNLYYKVSGSPSGISQVKVRVWPSTAKSKARTYTATDLGNGKYRVRVNILKHGAVLGKYRSACYVTMGNGIRVKAGSRTCTYAVKNTVNVTKTKKGQRKITLTNPSGGSGTIRFAIWSETGGQDDLKWYEASCSGKTASVTVKTSDFRHGGTYQVHMYQGNTCIRKTTFSFPYAELKTSYTEMAAGLPEAEETSQLILVDSTGTSAKVVMLNKNADGTWFQLLKADGYVGSEGVGQASESSRRTPAGTYGFLCAFGIKDNPGTKLSYTKVDDSHYWVDDPSSAYYNKFVSSRDTGIAWNSAEHLIDCTNAYAYALALDYNKDCVPGAGSAIFLHCSTGGPTAGCISVPEQSMIRILQCVEKNCKIIIS